MSLYVVPEINSLEEVELANSAAKLRGLAGTQFPVWTLHEGTPIYLNSIEEARAFFNNSKMCPEGYISMIDWKSGVREIIGKELTDRLFSYYWENNKWCKFDDMVYVEKANFIDLGLIAKLSIIEEIDILFKNIVLNNSLCSQVIQNQF